MSLSASNDANAGALFQSTVQAAGVDVHGLGELAQVQLAIASLYVDAPPGSVAAADISGSTTFGANVPYTDTYTFPAGIALSNAITVAGSASSLAGTVRYLGSPAGSAVSMAHNVPSTGSHNWRIAGSTTASLSASAFTLTVAGEAYAISGRTTALTADVASGAITFNANVGTGTGAVGGYVFKVPVTGASSSTAQTLTTVLTLGATTTVFATFAGAVTVNAATQLGTSAGTDVTTIGGTGYGAGVASLRLNGLTTAATADQVGTLTNAPSAGNPAFWIPISIAGTVRYVPAWA